MQIEHVLSREKEIARENSIEDTYTDDATRRKQSARRPTGGRVGSGDDVRVTGGSRAGRQSGRGPAPGTCADGEQSEHGTGEVD